MCACVHGVCVCLSVGGGGGGGVSVCARARRPGHQSCQCRDGVSRPCRGIQCDIVVDLVMPARQCPGSPLVGAERRRYRIDHYYFTTVILTTITLLQSVTVQSNR